MNKIIWNTDVNAPCCPGEILNCDDESKSILIQTDWDFPGTAQTFGWSLRQVQAPRRKRKNKCRHNGTDGTVDCKECGLTATDFISAAYDWLMSHDGAIAEDPGYFSE